MSDGFGVTYKVTLKVCLISAHTYVPVCIHTELTFVLSFFHVKHSMVPHVVKSDSLWFSNTLPLRGIWFGVGPDVGHPTKGCGKSDSGRWDEVLEGGGDCLTKMQKNVFFLYFPPSPSSRNINICCYLSSLQCVALCGSVCCIMQRPCFQMENVFFICKCFVISFLQLQCVAHSPPSYLTGNYADV